jgi:hypothetical protein
MAAPRRIYSHRLNTEATFEATCPDCLTTIATEKYESDLRIAEDLHVCDSVLLALLWGPQRHFL